MYHNISKNERVGATTLSIRAATEDDISAVKCIADANKKTIGFVIRPALEKAASKGWLLVAEQDGEFVGFCNYRHCRNKRTTIYEICVAEVFRGRGVGRLLIDMLVYQTAKLNQSHITLKCTVENSANEFYRKLGFEYGGQQDGRKRKLNIWRKDL